MQRYWHRDPAPELAGLVSGIHGYAEGGDAMVGAVEAASLDVPLIVNFGGPIRIGLGRKPTQADRYGSFAAGLFLGPVLMDSDGNAQCIQVNFTPLGGSRFFGLPMRELANRMVPLDDLGDRGISGLAQRLAELRSRPPDPALAWAFRHLANSQGRARIGAISGRLEWSRRKLVDKFRHEFGLPPKSVARIIRFNAAQAMAGGMLQPQWADIAAACGYADQAHLTREFSELAGRPPAAWRATA
jgi:AraC-like DNA-binding protein